MPIIIIFIIILFWLVGYYTWTALELLVMSMFFTYVTILLKIWYVISDKQKYISLVVVVVVLVLALVVGAAAAAVVVVVFQSLGL